jgi:UDP-N-acetylmuramate dehydrogenase
MIKEATKPSSLLAQEFNLLQDFNLLIDEPMRNYTSFKIGGPADLLALPEDKMELKNLIMRAWELEIPVTLVGGGTNLLVRDRGIRGLVIITKQLRSKIAIQDTNPDTNSDTNSNTNSNTKTIIVDAGERLSKVCQFAINNNLSGLEFAAGIPGTIGGAIKMNAGTKSGDMSTIIKSIEVLDENTFEINKIDNRLLDFSYRHLDLSQIIVSATLTLKKEKQKKIEDNFIYNLIKRNANQPVSEASPGCFFKNPPIGKSAGELIEKSGLKGVKVNDAMISEKHANFIVNRGNASCEDVLSLKQQIQKRVFDKFNIQLENEVKIEGE